jgi:tetratricopeptide (TPR) repeat protein
MTENRKTLLVYGTIVAACMLVFAQTGSFDFINIDDRAYVYENPAVLSGLNWRSISWAFAAIYSGNWHPLTWLSHMTDVTIFGLDPGRHHLVNVLLHTANSALVFYSLRRYTNAIWLSAAVALLFAVHPAHVESVAWIAERKDLLSALFWLLTMIAYERYARETASGSRRTWLVLSVFAFALGLMAKPMLVTLPFALLLMDYWPLGRLKSVRDLRPLVIEKLPFFALTIASSVITFVAQRAGGATLSITEMSMGARFANAAVSYAKYLVTCFYPNDLAFWYPLEPERDPIPVIGSVVLQLIVTGYAYRKRSRYPFFITGWLWFLGTLVPVIGLVQIGMQDRADRYTYIPYIGVFVIIVWGSAAFLQRFEKGWLIGAGVAAAAFTGLGMLAHRQTAYWQNSQTLYEHSLAVTRNNYFLMSNLCLHHIKRSDTATAERRCSELLLATPPSAEAFNILGLLRSDVGKHDEAITFLNKALAINPNWGILYANRSLAMARQGKIAEAERDLGKAVAIRDGSTSAEAQARLLNVIGEAYLKRGDAARANERFAQALELKPDLEEAAANLRRSTQ